MQVGAGYQANNNERGHTTNDRIMQCGCLAPVVIAPQRLHGRGKQYGERGAIGHLMRREAGNEMQGTGQGQSQLQKVN